MMDTVANTFPVITQTKKTTNQPVNQGQKKSQEKFFLSDPIVSFCEFEEV